MKNNIRTLARARRLGRASRPCCHLVRLFAENRTPTRRAPALTPSNVTLTPAQRPANPPVHGRAVQFRKTIETTGVVDFDNDQATSVLAPFSGPVSRLLVSLGDQVKQGASAGGRRFAGLRHRHQHLSQGHCHRTDRPPPRRSGQGSVQHNGVAEARGGASGNRRRQRRGRPRRGAASAGLAAGSGAQTIKDIQDGRPVARLDGVDSRADRRNRGGETHHARPAAAGRHHAVLHRRRSFARLGHGADL